MSILPHVRVIEINGEPYVCSKADGVQKSLREYELAEELEVVDYRLLSLYEKHRSGNTFAKVIESKEISIEELPVAL